jgi:sigma-E factor negative regulatory protein RseB
LAHVAEKSLMARLLWPAHWVAAAAVLLALALPAAATGDDPRAWVARMNGVLATRNYDGVFVHQLGPKQETLRIIHRMKDGHMAERLVSTDGSGREFVRNGSEWVAYYPDHKIVRVERLGRSSGFIGALHGLGTDAEANYEIRDTQRARVQGIATRLITVTPRDNFRYGYRFWIDEKTSMPVKTQLVAASGEIIEQIVFISLTMPRDIDDEMLKADVDTTDFRWLRRDIPPQPGALKVAFVPRGELLPAGFRVAKLSDPAGDVPDAPRSRYIISDGMAWVSVFIEPLEAQQPASRVGGPRPQNGAVQMGASAAYTLSVDGYRVTAVGEVPPATVRAIAESLRSE